MCEITKYMHWCASTIEASCKNCNDLHILSTKILQNQLQDGFAWDIKLMAVNT